MGMFDTIFNNYFRLGPEFDGELQSKDLHNCMDNFWISPAGELYVYDESEAWKWIENDEPPTDRLHFGYIKTSTGQHIKLRPKRFCDYITVYPANWNGSYNEWPEATLHIKDGKVESFTKHTKGEFRWAD